MYSFEVPLAAPSEIFAAIDTLARRS
jgi:hypothetical protein